jgi:hypothetical protein
VPVLPHLFEVKSKITMPAVKDTVLCFIVCGFVSALFRFLLETIIPIMPPFWVGYITGNVTLLSAMICLRIFKVK